MYDYTNLPVKGNCQWFLDGDHPDLVADMIPYDSSLTHLPYVVFCKIHGTSPYVIIGENYES
jgi:hypothetical protein